MNKPLLTITITMAVALSGLLSAETLELRTGEVILGDVELLDSGDLAVTVQFPTPRQLELSRDQLTPLSLYNVLERRVDDKDAAARLELGQQAEELGLHGQAIAQYRGAASLDPQIEKQMAGRVKILIDQLADRLLTEASELIDEGQDRTAIMYLRSLLEHYPDTPAASRARELVAAAEDRLATAEAKTGAGEPPDKIERTLRIVEEHLTAGQRLFKPTRGHVLGSVKRQRAGEKALRHYEAAWETAQRLPQNGGTDDELATRVRDLKLTVKDTLVASYLELGSIHVQRRSIPSAEVYCQKACELDPENRANHELHELILLAKTAYGDNSR